MGQIVFFILFVIALIMGAFAYFTPSDNNDPLKFLMNNSGYQSVETLNTKRIQELNVSMSGGLFKIRRLIDELAVKQDNLLDTIRDQQQMLKGASKDADNVLRAAQKQGGSDSKDILKIKNLASSMQDQQRLLVAQGQDLILLNDQIANNRQLISEQADAASVNDQSVASVLQQHYSLLASQADDFLNKVSQYNQAVADQLSQARDTMNALAVSDASCAEARQVASDHIQDMMEQEHEDMQKIADMQEANNDLSQDNKEKQDEENQKMKDSVQNTQDLMEEEQQKSQDQKEQQQIQEQELQDRENQ